MTAVKFCGFTREEDVRVAVRLGAQYLGLNQVLASPRFVPPSESTALAKAARDEADRLDIRRPVLVGVFAVAAGEAVAAARRCGLDAVQLHGPSACRDLECLAFPSILAVRPRAGEAVLLPTGAWAYLVDAHDDVLLGGTGRLADWGVAAEIAGRARVFLAGGLTPDNVERAVARVRPFAVDVASGIESAPGVKDHALMGAFIEAVRRADDRLHD